MTLASKALTAHSVNARPKLTPWVDQEMRKAVFALDVEHVTSPQEVAPASVATTGNVAKAKLSFFKRRTSSITPSSALEAVGIHSQTLDEAGASRSSSLGFVMAILCARREKVKKDAHTQRVCFFSLSRNSTTKIGRAHV